MKVLFLGIGGVLSTPRCVLAYGQGGPKLFDPIGVRLINKLYDEYDIDVVLSSSWRTTYTKAQIAAIFQQEGVEVELCQVKSLWKTPVIENGSRGQEIAEWLASAYGHGIAVKNVAILNKDDAFLPSQTPFLVKTDAMNGFLLEHYIKADRLLKK